MASSFRRVALSSILALGMVGFSAGADAGDMQGKGKGQKKAAAHPAAVVIVIDQGGHRQVVGDYFSHATLPPGLAKREALPPGLRKQLIEKGRLPPGLDKHFTPVPQELIILLPAIPTYYHRYFAGRDLVVVDIRTNRFVAIIRDILQ